MAKLVSELPGNMEMPWVSVVGIQRKLNSCWTSVLNNSFKLGFLVYEGDVSARNLPEYPKNIPGRRREEGLIQNSWCSHVGSLLDAQEPCPTGSTGQPNTTSGKRRILILPQKTQECNWREGKGCQDWDIFIGISWFITSIQIKPDTHEYWEYW